METRKKWNSCRLAPHGESGRIRWRVGQERTWQVKLKILVFVPLILLAIIAFAILVTYLSQTKVIEESTANTPSVANFDENERNDREKTILNFAQTSFIPNRKLLFDYETFSKSRLKRDIEIKTSIRIPTNFTKKDYEDFPYHPIEPVELPASCGLKRCRNLSGGKSQDYKRNFWKDQSTPEDVRKMQAETMMKYMNKDAEPCFDFYQYACGNWNLYNPIPPDKAVFDTFEILRENLHVVLRDLLVEYDVNENQANFVTNGSNKEASMPDLEDPYMKAKDLYSSCINQELINRRGEKPLLVLLKKLKGWPILDNTWSEDEFDVLWLLAQLRMYNNDILISEWVGPDMKNSEEYLIQFDQTTLGLPTRDFFLLDSNVKYLEAYRVYMITVTTLLGAQINNATRDADRMIDFETSLARITVSQEKRRNVSDFYTRMTVGELQTVIPQLDWIRYLKIITQVEVDPTQIIVCYCLDYLQDLMILLAQTPHRTVANYILWRFVRHRVNNLDERFYEAQQRFYYVILGLEETPPRWQTCVSQVNSHMGMTVGSLFVQKYFDETSKNETLEMTKEIRESFRNIVSETYWLDNETRQIAELKLDAMKLRIGYPDFILSKENLRHRYLDVKIRRNYYFENILSILKHLTIIEHERLLKKVDKSLWNTPPAVVNAYYSRNKNQIMFPAGILQPPFYQKSFPRCLNYGGIGVVIGHEITHGFDDKGRLFDQEGNLHRWWKDSSIGEFHKRAQCLSDQYNAYIVPDVQMEVDGVTTQGENIADNGGIKQSYKAYMKWLEQNPDEDETLPGLNLTSQQLFFLNFAQVWCGSSRPEAMKNRIKTAVHAPGQFRVIGTLSNSEDFAQAFNCPLGSPMNPKNKCTIW